ncbi:hypothetical protein [Georgenia sp. AZ-5]|uniref:hypothetical protein n=1 Tax=Georgenia sp. AZ-5 TaxID=3367526 RepID=UPI0037547DA2
MHRRALGALAATTVTAAVAITAIPSSASTGGTGGAFTDRTFQSFTASNGMTSQYHVYASDVSTDEPVGLMLQFHGDGAYEFKNPSSSYSLGGSEGIVAQAREHGMITVPVLSPDKQGSVTWWESGAENADYVADLLSHLYDQYDIDTERVWLVGYSGGSQFITKFFMPEHSDLVDGGGSVVFGGGGVPGGGSQGFDAGLTPDFPMHWYTGMKDNGSGGSYNALRDAQNGSAWYDGQGFATTLETPAGVDHGLSGTFGPVVGQQLDLHDDGSAATPTAEEPTTGSAPSETVTPDAAEPETTAPTEPETTAPTEPETTAPTEPETTAPTEPETTEPKNTAPTEPETTEPETTAPTEPKNTAPQTARAHEPARPTARAHEPARPTARADKAAEEVSKATKSGEQGRAGEREHTVKTSRQGVEIDLRGVANAQRLALRVTTSDTAEAKWVVEGVVSGGKLELSIPDGLTADTTYHFEITLESDDSVIATGTFTTKDSSGPASSAEAR